MIEQALCQPEKPSSLRSERLYKCTTPQMNKPSPNRYAGKCSTALWRTLPLCLALELRATKSLTSATPPPPVCFSLITWPPPDRTGQTVQAILFHANLRNFKPAAPKPSIPSRTAAGTGTGLTDWTITTRSW